MKMILSYNVRLEEHILMLTFFIKFIFDNLELKSLAESKCMFSLDI